MDEEPRLEPSAGLVGRSQTTWAARMYLKSLLVTQQTTVNTIVHDWRPTQDETRPPQSSLSLSSAAGRSGISVVEVNDCCFTVQTLVKQPLITFTDKCVYLVN